MEGAAAGKLVISEYGKSPREYRILGDVVRIGRDPGGEIVLWDPAVSRAHARIVRRGADFMLEDLGSRNGIRVNLERLPELGAHPLRDGDRIEVGRSILRFILEFARKITSKLLREAGTAARAAEETSGQAAAPPACLCLFRLEKLEAALLAAMETGTALGFSLRSDITRIGRGASADVQLADPSVSENHAEIVYNAEGFHVVDRDSEQGTFLDGVTVRLARIGHHSYLRFGKVKALFVVRREGEEPPAASFSLRDRLLDCFPEKRVQIQTAFRDCRERPVDLAEELIARGVLDPEEWWAAVRSFKKEPSGLLRKPALWMSRFFRGREGDPG